MAVSPCPVSLLLLLPWISKNGERCLARSLGPGRLPGARSRRAEEYAERGEEMGVAERGSVNRGVKLLGWRIVYTDGSFTASRQNAKAGYSVAMYKVGENQELRPLTAPVQWQAHHQQRGVFSFVCYLKNSRAHEPYTRS